MQARPIILTFRVDEAELKELQLAVAASGLPRSEYIRRKILKARKAKVVQPAGGKETCAT